MSRGRRQKRRIPNAWRTVRPGVGLCTACGVWAQLTKDHIVPLSLGGTWDLTNMQLICEQCNVEKADSLTWQPPLKRRIKW